MLLEKKLAPNRCFDMEVNIEGNPTLFKFFLRYPYSCAHIFKTSKWVATILTWNSSKLILSYPFKLDKILFENELFSMVIGNPFEAECYFRNSCSCASYYSII